MTLTTRGFFVLFGLYVVSMAIGLVAGLKEGREQVGRATCGRGRYVFEAGVPVCLATRP